MADRKDGDTGYEAIPSQILVFAPFHKDVGFVDEENGIPLLCAREIVFEVYLGIQRHSADVADG